MNRAILHAVAAALLGALAGPAVLAVVYSRHAAVQFEMDRDLPQSVSGLYGVERNGADTYAWASRRVQLALPGVSRSSPWTCALRFRGARPEGIAQPTVDLAIDNVTRASRVATNTYQDIEIPVPPRAGTGLVFTITSSTTLYPARTIGASSRCKWTRFSCRPAGAFVMAPRRALTAAALAAAVFGAGFALAGVRRLPRSPAC